MRITRSYARHCKLIILVASFVFEPQIAKSCAQSASPHARQTADCLCHCSREDWQRPCDLDRFLLMFRYAQLQRATLLHQETDVWNLCRVVCYCIRRRCAPVRGRACVFQESGRQICQALPYCMFRGLCAEGAQSTPRSQLSTSKGLYLLSSHSSRRGASSGPNDGIPFHGCANRGQ